MSVITHRTLICDRCGFSQEAVEHTAEMCWGMMEAGANDGSFKIGTVTNRERSADLCPSCLMHLWKWFKTCPQSTTDAKSAEKSAATT